MKKLTTLDLVYMAFYAALFMVLDYFTNMIPFLKMPNGGSIGVSTIALIVCSYHLGMDQRNHRWTCFCIDSVCDRSNVYPTVIGIPNGLLNRI